MTGKVAGVTSPAKVAGISSPAKVAGVALGSLVDYSFTSGSLPTGTSFTRASAGTYFNSSGVLSSSAIDVARFDYNPSTLAIRGVLIEPQRTNKVYRSVDNGSWGTQAASRTINSAAAPDGTLTGSLEVPNAETGNHWLYTDASQTDSGVSYVLSAYYKTSGYYGAGIDMYSGGDYGAMFNISTDTLVINRNNNLTGSGIEDVGNGWKRIWIAFTASGINYYPGVQLSVFPDLSGHFDGMGSGDGTSGIYIWGSNLVQDTKISSCIPSSGSTVTRAADQLSFTIPSGVSTLRYTFDDDSTQDVSVSAGSYTVPTNLNRPHIKRIQSV